MSEKRCYPNWFLTDGLENFVSHLLKEYKGRPAKLLQLGAYLGDASMWIFQNLLNHPDSFLVDVDTWEGSNEPVHKQWDWSDLEKEYDKKTERARSSHKIIKYKMTSDEFFKGNKQVFDFTYIDGDHTAYGVIKDAVNAYESLRVGGIIAFDDYEWSAGLGPQNEPRMAIDAFANIYQDRVRPTFKGYQAWFRKIA